MKHCPEVLNSFIRRSLQGAVILLFSCLPFQASALLDYEEDLNLQADWNKDHVEEDECLQAWPVDCAEGSGGNSECGGWRVLSDTAQSETWPGDNQATCSTGVRLSLGSQETKGQAVGAMFPGTVLFAQSGRSRDGNDYGGVIVVKLDLDDGSPQCFARYMFLDRRDMVRVGTKVKAGQRIGSVASDDMSPTKRWWQENWGNNFPAQVKIDIGCDEALVNLPHFLPKEPYEGAGPEDLNSCALTKLRFPTPPLLYLTKTEHGRNVQCKVGIRKDARKFKAAPPQDDSEKRTKLNAYWISSVKPRGVIRHKSTPVYALFGNDIARETLYGANPNAVNRTSIMRNLENYRDATTFNCDNMLSLYRGKNGQELKPEEVRELFNHCTNQFILGRSMNPTVQELRGAPSQRMNQILRERQVMFLEEEVQEEYRKMVEENKTEQEIYDVMEDEVAKVFFRDYCQPLSMQTVSFRDYAPHLVLSKAWNELLIDWPEENDLEPIERVAFDAININQYTRSPYEKIIDPSHPFSPRHIFAETERERYTNYGVQCAATPVDIILGTYGENKENQRTYGRRDRLFHQCISCRIEINERENAACFPDPYSFRTLGGCPNGSSLGGTICENLPAEYAEPLTRLSMEFGIRRDFLEYILYRESSCATLDHGSGRCPTERGHGGGGRGPWQIDLNWHPISYVDESTWRIGTNAISSRSDSVGNNACDFYEGGRYAVAQLVEEAQKFDCRAGPIVVAYNAGFGDAMEYYRRNYDEQAIKDNVTLWHITLKYVRELQQWFQVDENICLEGGPYPKGDGPTTGGTGDGASSEFRWGDVFGNGGGQSGGSQSGGTHTAPRGERFQRVTGAELVRAGLERMRGRPYSMTGPRLDIDGSHTDCSGFVILSVEEATGIKLYNGYGAFHSVSLEEWATGWNRSKYITRAEARDMPGAILSKGGRGGGGAAGHVGLSVGDGTIAETASDEGRLVGCSDFDTDSTFVDFYKFPDWLIDYDPARNKPIQGLCNMIRKSEQGICRYALPVAIAGKEDLTPPEYLTDYTPKTVTMPNPPSLKRGDPYEVDEPGMVYEGAWKACLNLQGEMREECERLHEEREEERREAQQRANGSITGGNSSLTHPAPCTTITPGRRFNLATPHRGIDYAGPEGHPIVSVADGTISYIWNNSRNTYGSNDGAPEGIAYQVTHTNGEKSIYLHMSQRCDLNMGDSVTQGQVLGYIGNTGRSTGPHLHFGLINQQGQYVDPLENSRGLPSENQPNDFCETYKELECDAVAGDMPMSISGPTLCVDKPCSVRYDEADVVAQCAYPTNEGGCGTLGNFAQSNRGDENGDCCFYITAPVTPLNNLKMRPGFDEEVPAPGSDDPEEYIEGAWKGERTRSTVRQATEEKDPYWGEGGQVDVSDTNPGAPEGYSFHEWFRNHRPFMRWWDTGAESGSILQETAEPDAPWGMYDTLVGVGVEKENCGFGGWGTTADINPNSSWMELKLYQARTLNLGKMRCIGRYEQHFKPRNSEDFVHRLAGGDFSSILTNRLINWPLSWRGYVSDTDEQMRFPAYLDKNRADGLAGTAMVGVGIDNAMPGDILVYDWDVVNGERIPHVAYVLEAETSANVNSNGNTSGLSDVSWFQRMEQGELPHFVTVEEYNFGKYPDSCGNTNWMDNSVKRRLYKTSLPVTDRENAASNKVTNTNCDNPDISACVERLWDRVKIYRPAEHVRR